MNSQTCHLDHIQTVKPSFDIGSDVFATDPNHDVLSFSAYEKWFLDIVKQEMKQNDNGYLKLHLPLKKDAILPKVN